MRLTPGQCRIEFRTVLNAFEGLHAAIKTIGVLIGPGCGSPVPLIMRDRNSMSTDEHHDDSELDAGASTQAD